VNDRTRVLLIAVLAVVITAGALSYVALVATPGPPGASPPGGTAVCPTTAGASPAGDWTTYHRDNSRAGAQPMANVTSLRPAWTGPTSLDGQVYAEPLVCGGTVYVATEEDSIYAIHASDGAVLWRTHLGAPMLGSSLPCGDISPSGITGTPVIDAASGTLYAVAFVSPGEHFLFGLDVANGSVRSQVAVDPNGSDPLVQQQRGALTVANGRVYVVFGGLYGDCGSYHGWVVGVPLAPGGGLLAYEVPTQREGAVWGAAGTAVGANGELYVATGNGASSSTFDHGDSVIELSPTLQELGYFAPSNWAQLNRDDTDLGSVAPTMLPDGDLFQIGKAGVGYLLSGTRLGGIGGEIANLSVCGGAYGGTARLGMTVIVPCTDGLVEVVAGSAGLSLGWRSSSFDAGSPIVTGNVVWAVDESDARLLGFSSTTGQLLFTSPLGSVDHFITPAAAPGALFVAGGTQLFGFAVA
jgi:PQQ-like domain